MSHTNGLGRKCKKPKKEKKEGESGQQNHLFMIQDNAKKELCLEAMELIGCNDRWYVDSNVTKHVSN